MEIEYFKRVIKCKYCNKPEYYGEFRWLNGRQLCRSCYRVEYEHEYKEPYKWDDLDGERPSMELLLKESKDND